MDREVRRPGILFLTHETTRTGAPLLLLALLRWLRRTTDLDLRVVTIRGGSLHAELAAVAPVVTFDWTGGRARWTGIRLVRRVRRLGGLAHRLHLRYVTGQLRRLAGGDPVYASSAASLVLGRHLPLEVPLVTHVHELTAYLEQLQEHDDIAAALRRSTRVVACADLVRDRLVEFAGLAPDRVEVEHEYLVRALPEEQEQERVRREVRAELGLGADDLVVLASGTQDWRKGVDLFVQLALDVARVRGRVGLRFVWVGGSPGDVLHDKVRFDVEQAELGDLVTIVDETPDPARWFAAADLLTLTSREDPFPLVCLEAAAMGLACVAFRCGGIGELLEPDGGVIVPPLDVAAMTDAVVALLADQPRREQMGRVAQGRALQHTVEVAGPRLLAVIEQARSEAGAAPAGRGDRPTGPS